MRLWIVDAFTDRPYKGNPAAVTIITEFPDDETCLNIAAEMNLSETAFIKHLSGNRFHIRWFTPEAEVELCGHATLASAHIINQEKLVSSGNIVFDSLSGVLEVSFSPSGYVLDFPLSKKENPIEVSEKFGKISNAVRIDDDVVIELPGPDQVRNFVPPISEIAGIDCRGVIITSKDTDGKYDFVSRFFSPRLGVNEDPVTGSAHCKLALYWQKRLRKSEFLAYQASERGGEIGVLVVGDRVHLSGKAVTVLSGDWQV